MYCEPKGTAVKNRYIIVLSYYRITIQDVVGAESVPGCLSGGNSPCSNLGDIANT